MSAPFVDPSRPDLGRAELRWCGDCQGYYWSDYPHDCPVYDPLRGAEGIFLAACAGAVVLSLLYLAGVIRLGWPWR